MVSGGDVLGTVQETELVVHKIMVPPGVAGKVKSVGSGNFLVTETIASIETDDGREVPLGLMTKWPVRKPRPYKEKLAPDEPLSTGQRVIDAFFPLGKGGTACVPGPFGSGKTVIQHQLAKWADAEIIVYVGCGERGNEMTDVLLEFPELKDPHSGEPLINRTVLIANTSNMPVAAREASVYTGITIAEYFRDMGYSVARHGRLDLPVGGGDARDVGTARGDARRGRISGLPRHQDRGVLRAGGQRGLHRLGRTGREPHRRSAPSPLRAVTSPTRSFRRRSGSSRCSGASRTSSPSSGTSRRSTGSRAIRSTTRTSRTTSGRSGGGRGSRHAQKPMTILQEEAELEEIVRLVGVDSLSPSDRITLETARSIREDFLHQNAFHEVDTYCLVKEDDTAMLKLILQLHRAYRSRMRCR